MQSIEEQLLGLTQMIIRAYYVDGSFAIILPYINTELRSVFAGYNETVILKTKVIELLEEDCKNLDNKFLINTQWYNVEKIGEDNVLVLCDILFDYELNGHTNHKKLLGSAIWKKDNDKWYIASIHNMANHGQLLKEGCVDLYHNNDREIDLFEQIKNAKYLDQIALINNYAGFEKSVEHFIRQEESEPYVLIKIGIRDFRFINRKHGYDVGDIVLRNVAMNLQKTLRLGESCGRIERDTFGLLYHFYTRNDLNERIERVIKGLIDHELLLELGMVVNYNAGIYVIQDNHHEFIKDMLDKALIAQQSINRYLMGNQIAYFEEGMLKRQIENSKMLEDAVVAMHDDEFKLYIQPQFDIKSRSIIAGEALARWYRKDGSITMPNDFIPLFEDFGTIISFDFHMLEKLCIKLSEWIVKGIKIPPISINQSRLHIEEDSYLDDFCSVVDKYNIPHEYIAFELTESAFVEHGEKMLKLASELHQRGFKLSLDDFGTGYASLNLLSVVAVDILKIDKSLLNDYSFNPRTRVVMQKIIELAHQMDMKVVCEGIETEQQLNFLLEQDCDMGQGYLVGKPIEADNFAVKWLNN